MRLELQHRAFSERDFEEVVRVAARMTDDATVPDQVRYLVTYLSHHEMAASSMLIERPYVDRHYLTEYQGYYATALRDVPRHTTRVHLFAAGLDLDEARSHLSLSDTADARLSVQRRLQASYLGFIVVRPLPTAPIGRTVLRWYGGRDARCFGPHPPPHRVHILGLTLKAHGVQFHQQDHAVGACATAAVWCALAAVMRRDGGRSPTPIAVTQQAIRSLPTSRALPAVGGLTLEQMVGAINASGYSPDVIKPEGNPAIFQLQLMTYVRSGIPVILQVREEGAEEGHAVTVAGFRVADGEHDAPAIEHPISASRSLRAKGMTRVYVNDDRLGPYARMVWLADPEPEQEPAPAPEPKQEHEHGNASETMERSKGEYSPAEVLETDESLPAHEVGGLPSLVFRPHAPGFDEFCRRMRIWTAIAPLYPKIRINALDLLSVATEVWPMAAFQAGAEREDLLLESFFSLGGSYAEGIYDLAMDARRAADIASSLLLSRYVGVLRFAVADRWLLDVVCDATDIHRKAPAWNSVLAVLFANPEQAEALRSQMERQYPHVVVQ